MRPELVMSTVRHVQLACFRNQFPCEPQLQILLVHLDVNFIFVKLALETSVTYAFFVTHKASTAEVFGATFLTTAHPNDFNYLSVKFFSHLTS